jgi:hypothetical protein
VSEFWPKAVTEVGIELLKVASVAAATSLALSVGRLVHVFEAVGDRRRALHGRWRGSFVQNMPGGRGEASLVLDIKAGLRIITGDVAYDGSAEIGGTVHQMQGAFTVRGGFIHDRFLKLDYRQKDRDVVQFGSVVLDLHPDGRTLTGKGVGFGSKTRMIVAVEISLEKDPI